MDKQVYLMQEVCFVEGSFLDTMYYMQSGIEVLLDKN